MRTPILLFLTLTALGPVALGQHEEHGNVYSGPEEGGPGSHGYFVLPGGG